MNSSGNSSSNNPSNFSGVQTPQAAAQAFTPAGGQQTFNPAPVQAAPSFNGAQASQAVVAQRGQQTFTPPPQAQAGATVNADTLKSAIDTATQAVKEFADVLKQIAQGTQGNAGGVSQPASAAQPMQPAQGQSPQAVFRQGAVDEVQPTPAAVTPDNQFKPAPVPDSPVEPLAPASSMPPEWKQDKNGRWRDERGQYVPRDKLRETGVDVPDSPVQAPQGGGGGGGGGAGLLASTPLGRIATGLKAVGGFVMGQAGSTSINQALQGLPMGGLIAGSLSKLEEMGMKGAEFELSALQAGMTRGLGQGMGYATSNASYSSIRALSNRLGVSPSAAASILRDVGTGTGGELSVEDIAGLTVRGFDPASISALGGQLQGAGVGGAGTVLQTMGIARAQGLNNAQVMSFAQATAGFATGRRMTGLDITDASMTARRARSMILRDEQSPSLEANLATLGRFQSVGVTASKGLSGFAAGMSDMMLQAYAFEQSGGDIFKATALLEDMSADPVKMREAMKAQGASDEQVDIALLATGQLTTTDIRRGRQAGLGERAGRMRTTVADTRQSLAASRAVAEKGQRDLEQLYGTTGGGGESVVSRFNTLLKEQSNYQAAVLKKMPTSTQISNIVQRLTTILETTDFMKSIAMNLYGSKATQPAGNMPMGSTKVKVGGGKRF
jgi:hypothetical protein